MRALTSLLLFLSASGQVPAQGINSPLVGAWELTSFARKDMTTGKVAYPLGEQVTGVRIHTPGGHASYMFVDKNRKAPAGSMTDADRGELFKTLAAGSGTYKIEGDKVRFQFVAAANPASTGSVLVYRFAIDGRTLSMTTDPIKGADGNEVSFITTYQRLE